MHAFRTGEVLGAQLACGGLAALRHLYTNVWVWTVGLVLRTQAWRWGGGARVLWRRVFFFNRSQEVQPGSRGRDGVLWKQQAGEGVDMVEAGCSLEEVLFIPTFPI